MNQKQLCQVLAQYGSDRRVFWRTVMRLLCSSCAQANDSESRYCTRCGVILNPIFCATCGTVNPSGLGNCLQCGSILPDMSGIRWAPSVKIIRPTEAMANRNEDKTCKSNE